MRLSGGWRARQPARSAARLGLEVGTAVSEITMPLRAMRTCATLKRPKQGSAPGPPARRVPTAQPRSGRAARQPSNASARKPPAPFYVGTYIPPHARGRAARDRQVHICRQQARGRALHCHRCARNAHVHGDARKAGGRAGGGEAGYMYLHRMAPAACAQYVTTGAAARARP